MTASVVVPLRVRCDASAGFARTLEPVSVGIPFPRGAARDDDRWTLQAGDGASLPLQIRVLDRWPDGSIRWALLDSRVTIAAGMTAATLTLRQGLDPEPDPSPQVRIDMPATDELSIDTGAVKFRLSPNAPLVLARVDVAGDTAFDETSSKLIVCDATGEQWPVSWQPPSIEFHGPLRVGVVAHGAAKNPSGAQLRLTLRLDFHAGLASVRTRLTVTNPRRARHPRGIWELGDAGSILLREVSLVLQASRAEGSRVRWSLEPECWEADAQAFHLYQDSSGGDNWAGANHVNRHGHVPLRLRGYEADADGRRITGLRATPIVVIDGASMLGVAVPQFWQNFPRALTATASALTVSFFPGDASDVQELQGGEQKAHECHLLFGRDTVTDQPLEWCRSPLLIHPAPDWYASSDAVRYLVTSNCDDGGYRGLVDAAVEGTDTFLAKRERADEYGWRHFGEIYGDHEAIFHTGASPLMSHYNNQYDAVAGCFYQFMRTGDPRWWTQCLDLAAHVIDIDLYHTDEDKSAYNHGLFWHTYHYVDAGKSTHRSYPTGTVGGGPSAEHNYTTGLMLHYFATGEAASRDAALGLAQFVVDIDDGTRTVFRWLDSGYTGVASASRSTDYHGPGRGSGNSLNALLDGHRLSGDRRYLDKAEQIIRRCTHPRQDLAALHLLDPENRWFYTMYLQSIGKYLDWKVELGEIDEMYGYGRDVLLHFARWMAQHERPYLSRPDLLEYPTETWAAQDIRKSEVFDCAARHAQDAERAQFLERAEFYFNYSIATLQTMPTRTLARPVVLLLAHGFRRAHVRQHGITPAPAPREGWSSRWPDPEVFVTQKVRARRRAVKLAVMVTAFGAAGLTGLLWLLVR